MQDRSEFIRLTRLQYAYDTARTLSFRNSAGVAGACEWPEYKQGDLPRDTETALCRGGVLERFADGEMRWTSQASAKSEMIMSTLRDSGVLPSLAVPTYDVRRSQSMLADCLAALEYHLNTIATADGAQKAASKGISP